jgi:hypothetical protein
MISQRYNRIKTGGGVRNYWRVFPGEFKIRRSNDRPFTYRYTIEFTAVDKREAWARLLKSGVEAKDMGIATVKGSLETLKEGLKALKEGQKQFNASMNGSLNKLINNAQEVESIIEAYGEVMAGYVDVVTGVIEEGDTIIKIPRDVTNKVLNLGVEFMNASLRLLQSVEQVTGSIRAMGTAEYWRPQEVLDRYSMTMVEYTDTWEGICGLMEDSANRVVTIAKSPAAVPEVLIDTAAGEPQVIVVYGNREAAVTAVDTLESLAMRFYGDPGWALIIAMYNGITSLDALKPGDTIKIPLLQRSQRNENNRIYARVADRDNYGRDIALSDDGKIQVAASGDYQLTGGAANLSQAIVLRLRESVDKRIRLNAYGIRTGISDPTVGISYIISSIDLTVRGDPRVESIDDIRFSGRGDRLAVQVDYHDINHTGGSAGGMV